MMLHLNPESLFYFDLNSKGELGTTMHTGGRIINYKVTDPADDVELAQTLHSQLNTNPTGSDYNLFCGNHCQSFAKNKYQLAKGTEVYSDVREFLALPSISGAQPAYGGGVPGGGVSGGGSSGGGFPGGGSSGGDTRGGGGSG